MAEHSGVGMIDQRLQDVLLRHLLPRLTLASIACLACSCRSLQSTVDELPPKFWQQKFAERLAWHPSVTPGATP